MGRICGCIGKTCDSGEMSRFLSDGYPLVKPEPYADSFSIDEDAALGAEGDGCFYESENRRYACLVDGKTFVDDAAAAPGVGNVHATVFFDRCWI